MLSNARSADVVCALERQLDAKCCAAAGLGFVVDRAIVHLHGAKCAREANAASAGARGEKKLEDSRAMLGSNAFAGIANANFGRVAVPLEIDRERSAARHGLDRVQN